MPNGWLSDIDNFSSPPAAKKNFRYFKVLHIQAAEGVVPTNTKKHNASGGREFHAWVEERNKAVPSDPVPDGLLACHDASTISKYCTCVTSFWKGEPWMEVNIHLQRYTTPSTAWMMGH